MGEDPKESQRDYLPLTSGRRKVRNRIWKRNKGKKNGKKKKQRNRFAMQGKKGEKGNNWKGGVGPRVW